MNSERQKRIEERAYALWEAEGRPHGKHEDHWQRATQEIAAEEAAVTGTKRALKRITRSAAESSGRRPPPRRKKTPDQLAAARS
jgi:hypothetical protein